MIDHKNEDHAELLYKITLGISKQLQKPIYVNFSKDEKKYGDERKRNYPANWEYDPFEDPPTYTPESNYKIYFLDDCDDEYFDNILENNIQSLIPEKLYNFILMSAVTGNEVCKFIINLSAEEVIKEFSECLYGTLQLPIPDPLYPHCKFREGDGEISVTIDHNNKIEIKELSQKWKS